MIKADKMINAEKYLKLGTNIDEFTLNFDDWHFKNSDVIGYGEALFRFLHSEAKPKLTEDERVILRNIDLENFKAIGRKDDYLYLRYTNYCNEYGETDIKTLTFWYMYHNLFKFIKNDEEYSIPELLSGNQIIPEEKRTN